MVWPEIGVFLGLALAAQGLGGWAARLLGPGPLLPGGKAPGPSPVQSMLLAQGLGLAGLVILAGGLSLLGRLRPWPAALVLVPSALAGLWSLRNLRTGEAREPLSGWEKLLLAGIVFHQLVYLSQALLPPLEGEGLHYLFNLAREYGQEGRVLYQPDRYASRPQNMVLLFSLAQLFVRAEAGQLLTWWLGLLTSLLLAALGKRIFGHRSTGLLAALIFSAMPLTGLISGRGMSDPGVCFFGLMGLLALYRASSGVARGRAWAALAGLFLGLAAGFKAVGLVLLLTGAFMALFEVFRSRLSLGRLAVLLALGLVAASPWYAYSYLHTGTLFFNLGTPQGPLSRADRVRLLGPDAEPEKEAARRAGEPRKPGKAGPPAAGDKKAAAPAAGKGPSPGQRIMAYLFSGGHNPISNFWRFSLIDDHRRRVTGPLILILVPLLLFIRPARPGPGWLLSAGAVQFALASLISGPYSRYGLPGLILLGLGGSWAWWGLFNRGGRAKVLALAVLFIGWVPLLPEAGYGLIHNLPAALGLEEREVFLDRANRGEYEVYSWANRNLPREAKVLSIAEHKAYYLDRKVVYGSLWRNPYIDYQSFLSYWELDARAREFGITHVLLNTRISDNAWDITPAQQERVRFEFQKWKKRVEAWAGRRMEKLICRGDLCLYRLKERWEE